MISEGQHNVSSNLEDELDTLPIDPRYHWLPWKSLGQRAHQAEDVRKPKGTMCCGAPGHFLLDPGCQPEFSLKAAEGNSGLLSGLCNISISKSSFGCWLWTGEGWTSFLLPKRRCQNLPALPWGRRTPNGLAGIKEEEQWVWSWAWMGLGTGKQRQHFLCHCRSFLVQAPTPPGGAYARGDCRDALGRFLWSTALEKSQGLGKSHQANEETLADSCMWDWVTTSMG